MIRRLSNEERLSYGILFSIIVILIMFAFFLSIFGIILPKILLSFSNTNMKVFILLVFTDVVIIISSYSLFIPELFRAYFSPKDSPIVFNRKTNKVYINESEYFSFKLRFHPSYLLHPRKKNIKEYDWEDLFAVAISNYSKISKNTIMLMVCTPGTYDVETHIILDHGRSGLLNISRWGWINNYMVDYDLYDDQGQAILLNLADYEQKTANADLSIYGWPEWMMAAFNATSLEQLNEIKQKYNVAVE